MCFRFWEMGDYDVTKCQAANMHQCLCFHLSVLWMVQWLDPISTQQRTADIDILCTVQYSDNIQYTVYNSIQQYTAKQHTAKAQEVDELQFRDYRIRPDQTSFDWGSRADHSIILDCTGPGPATLKCGKRLVPMIYRMDILDSKLDRVL